MAQAPSPGELEIALTARPDRALPGSRIVLSGQTGLVGAGSIVTLVIRPPGGRPPIQLKVTPGSSGGFSADFTTTQTLGAYQVRATAPDGKGTAQTTFTMVGAGVLPAEVGAAAEALVAAVGTVEARVRANLTALPPSPTRTEALAKLPELESRVKQLGPQATILRQQLGKLFQDRAKVTTPVPVWDDYQAELGSWRSEADSRRSALLKASPGAEAAARDCARIDDVIEDLTSMSEALSVFQKPFEATIALGFDKLPAGGLSRGTKLTSGQQFALVESAKAAGAALQGPAALATTAVGFILDIGAFLAKETFEQYCERFEGPIEATFLGESFTTKGEPFLDYTITLSGRLLLMYPNSVSGKIIPLQGYLEGAGRFRVRDNPAPIIRLTPGTVLFHRVQSPPGARYLADISRPTQSIMPHTFRIPVTGTLAGDSIVLRLGPADHDFSDLIKGISTYVIMPLGGLVPQIINSDISLQKAHPIIERTIRRNPVLRVAASGKTLVAERSFARDTANAEKTARVRTQLTIKVCNPGCLFAGAAKKP